MSAILGLKRYPSSQNSPNTTSAYAPVSVMISVGLSSVCCSSTTASSTKLSRSVPGTTMPLSAQRDQAIGFIEFVEASQDQIIFAVHHLLDSCAAVVRKIRRDCFISLIEFVAQNGKRLVSGSSVQDFCI